MPVTMAAKKAVPPVQLNLRVPPEMAVALDAWVEKMNARRTWPKLTRTDVLRSLLDWGVREQPDWVGK